MSNSQKFKAGDRVYYPSRSNKIHELYHNDDSNYPLAIHGSRIATALTLDGTEYTDHAKACVFHATVENHELLTKLYGVEFEEPPKPKTAADVIKAMLADGHKYVICYVGDYYDDGFEITENEIIQDEELALISEVTEDEKPFRSKNFYWERAIPLDPKSGKKIVDYLNGLPILED